MRSMTASRIAGSNTTQRDLPAFFAPYIAAPALPSRVAAVSASPSAKRDAYASADADLAVGDLDGAAEDVEHPLGDGGHLLAVTIRPFDQQPELVALETGCGILAA